MTGPDGQPFDPMDWHFVPGTTQLVVQTSENQVWLADPWNRSPARPLGGHNSIDGFVAGTRQLLLTDREQQFALDLATGARRPVPPATAPVGSSVYTAWEVLPPAPRPMLLSTPAPARPTPVISLVLGPGDHPVWSLDDGSTVDHTCLSPNGQYLAVDVVPAGAPADDYRTVLGYLGTRTTVIDTRRGNVAGTFEGGSSTWCR